MGELLKKGGVGFKGGHFDTVACATCSMTVQRLVSLPNQPQE